MRQVVLDTETTGLETSQGHRIIEIGCVELINRKLTGKHFHQYINPDREIDQGAIEVHGITNEFLADKPAFATIVDDFLAYVDGAELVIHNAAFDMGFLNAELGKIAGLKTRMESICTVVDTLKMAREKHPGQRNNLDALCQRYGVDNSQRDLHGALLDAEILADVYLLMTGGQTTFQLGAAQDSGPGSGDGSGIRQLDANRPKLRVIKASDEELERHQQVLQTIAASSDGKVVWRELDALQQVDNS